MPSAVIGKIEAFLFRTRDKIEVELSLARKRKWVRSYQVRLFAAYSQRTTQLGQLKVKANSISFQHQNIYKRAATSEQLG
jgi:hypothetical protein